MATSKTKKKVCKTCKKTTGSAGHMCVPAAKKDEKCEWCGSLIVNERHFCDKKVKKIAYVCNSCGRTAVTAEYLCQPEKIK